MIRSVSLKTKYTALFLCVMIVVTVAGGAVCLWLGNSPGTASFGMFPRCVFVPEKPISLSRTSPPKSEAWIASYDTYDVKDVSQTLALNVFLEVCSPLFIFFGSGQASNGAAAVPQRELFVLRI